MTRRTKKTDGGWSRAAGKFIQVALALALFVGSGWWLFFSKSDSKVRRATLDKLSIFVDRMDEVSQAWKDRKPPETLTVKTEPAKAQTETRAPARTEPVRSPERIAPPPAPPAPVAAPPPAPVKKPTPAAKPKPSVGEVTPEEQEQLRDLFKELNSK
jgi:hypothetical protein